MERGHLVRFWRATLADRISALLFKMSLDYLKEAVEQNDIEKLIGYVRLHFGDGNEEADARNLETVATLAHLISNYIFILSNAQENGFTMEKSNEQLRPGLWATVNKRYPGSMITKDCFVGTT